MHASVDTWARAILTHDVVRGRRVLEVGAYDVNGSIRPWVEAMRPAWYVGTDRRAGPRVDVVTPAENLTEHFAQFSFDIVVCLETLEHIKRWRAALSKMFAVLRYDGLLVLTTRSEGFPRHEHPDDYWRFDHREFGWLNRFGQIVALEDDPEAPGMFLAFRPQMIIRYLDLEEIRANRAPAAAS